MNIQVIHWFARYIAYVQTIKRSSAHRPPYTAKTSKNNTQMIWVERGKFIYYVALPSRTPHCDVNGFDWFTFDLKKLGFLFFMICLPTFRSQVARVPSVSRPHSSCSTVQRCSSAVSFPAAFDWHAPSSQPYMERVKEVGSTRHNMIELQK